MRLGKPAKRRFGSEDWLRAMKRAMNKIEGLDAGLRCCWMDLRSESMEAEDRHRLGGGPWRRSKRKPAIVRWNSRCLH